MFNAFRVICLALINSSYARVSGTNPLCHPAILGLVFLRTSPLCSLHHPHHDIFYFLLFSIGHTPFFCLPIGGDLAPSLGEREKISQTEISEWRFLWKNFHFHAQNFWWPFLVIDHVFQIFPTFFKISHILTACNHCNVVCDPSSQEKSLFQKIIPWWHLFYSVRAFARIRQTLLLKILGGRMHAWAVPSTSNSWGDRPPVSPRSPPLCLLPYSSSVCLFSWYFLTLSIAVADAHCTNRATVHRPTTCE